MAAVASNPFTFPSRRSPDDTLFYAVYPLPPPALLNSSSIPRPLPFLPPRPLPFLPPLPPRPLQPVPPARPRLPLRALRLYPRPAPPRRAPLRRLPPRRVARCLPPLRPHPRLPRPRRVGLGFRWGLPPHRGRLRAPALARPGQRPQPRLHVPRRAPHPPALPLPGDPSFEAALAAVYDDSVDIRASDAVQAAIQRRNAGLPERAAENLHTARVIVPAPVAKVLKEEPCLIARAVEGFYDRDIDTMKHAARMERFLKGPGGEGVEMVRTSVRMTRAMYAQLVQQNFQAPRGYPMPRREEGPEKWMEAELGMKIACGFEMMYQERRREGEEGKGSTWEVYRKSLEATGCFEGLLPGSKEYKRVVEDVLCSITRARVYSRERERY